MKNKVEKLRKELGISLSIVVFSALEALEILEAQMILIFLSAYLVFQYTAGILIFKFLLKKIMT